MFYHQKVARVRVFADIQNFALRAHCVHGIPCVACMVVTLVAECGPLAGRSAHDMAHDSDLAQCRGGAVLMSLLLLLL